MSATKTPLANMQKMKTKISYYFRKEIGAMLFAKMMMNDTLLVNIRDILIKVKNGNYSLQCKKKATIESDDDIVLISKNSISLKAEKKLQQNARWELKLIPVWILIPVKVIAKFERLLKVKRVPQ